MWRIVQRISLLLVACLFTMAPTYTCFGWYEVYEGPHTTGDFHYQLSVSSAGQLAVHGETMLTATDSDAHVLVYNADGTVALQDALNGGHAGRDHGRGAAFHPDGDVVVCGGLRASYHSDIYVTKMGLDGTVRWTHTVGGAASSNDVCYGLAVNAAGEIFATGVIRHNQDNAIWVAKLDAAGNLLWEDSVDTPLNESGFVLAPGSDGSVVVAGYRDDSVEGQNAWLSLYEADGTVRWVAEHNVTGVNGKDYSTGVVVDSSNAVYLIGFEEPAAGSSRNYVQKRSASDGSIVWASGIERADLGPLEVRSLFWACGGLYAGGTVERTAGAHEIFLRQVDPVAGTTLADEVLNVLPAAKAVLWFDVDRSQTSPTRFFMAGWIVDDGEQRGIAARVRKTFDCAESASAATTTTSQSGRRRRG